MKSKALLILLALFSLVGCRKDDDTPDPKIYLEENPLTGFLQNSGFSQKTLDYVNFNVNYEFGYRFRPLVKGQINAVSYKIPANATNVRVTLWNASTKSPLKTITIPNVVANTEIKQTIEPFSVDPTIEYLISYNGNDWYHRKKSDDTGIIYPVNVGNISITGYSFAGSTVTEQTYPVNNSNTYYGGDLSIIFQQTD
ncbi:hypothetical protein [Soonwooa purpurea]